MFSFFFFPCKKDNRQKTCGTSLCSGYPENPFSCICPRLPRKRAFIRRRRHRSMGFSPLRGFLRAAPIALFPLQGAVTGRKYHCTCMFYGLIACYSIFSCRSSSLRTVISPKGCFLFPLSMAHRTSLRIADVADIYNVHAGMYLIK